MTDILMHALERRIEEARQHRKWRAELEGDDEDLPPEMREWQERERLRKRAETERRKQRQAQTVTAR